MSKQVAQEDLDSGRLYPPASKIREVSVRIAADIAEWFYKNGKATLYPVPENIDEYLEPEQPDLSKPQPKQPPHTTHKNSPTNLWVIENSRL